uniref:Uncharacterized protein n=1 Tax=Anguilla anguilla TaxID=7936 RepID=A0A0E9XJ94_ANGAN
MQNVCIIVFHSKTQKIGIHGGHIHFSDKYQMLIHSLKYQTSKLIAHISSKL